MGKIVSYILTLALVLSSWSAIAQEKQPRVLLIGDSIAGMYSREASSALKGKAEVHAAGNLHDFVLNSSTIFEKLDQFLGRIDRNGNPVAEEKWPKWDLIHVNVGLGDLVHCVPDLKQMRLMPHTIGGVIATDAKQYEQNLDKLMRELKAKALGAKIVWASTTPIRFSRNEVFKMGTEIEYNAIAAKVMAKHRVPINDMHTYTKLLINMDKPAGHGADPFHFDKKPIHMPVVRVIEQTFRLKPMPETEEEKAVKQNASQGGVSQADQPDARKAG